MIPCLVDVLKKVFRADKRLSEVDGGAWRTHSPNANSDFDYPDFLLSADMDAGMQNSKL